MLCLKSALIINGCRCDLKNHFMLNEGIYKPIDGIRSWSYFPDTA